MLVNRGMMNGIKAGDDHTHTKAHKVKQVEPEFKFVQHKETQGWLKSLKARLSQLKRELEWSPVNSKGCRYVANVELCTLGL